MLYLILRIKLFQNIHDIIWELSIGKEHKMLRTDLIRNILLPSQKLTTQLGKHQ